MASIAKYTPEGIRIRRDLLSNGQKIILKTFKISNKDIDIAGENTVDDLPDSWIEKDITSYKTIDSDKILFTLNVKRDEAILEGRSFALYLEDGTPYIVGVPEAVFNRGMEQTYQVLIKIVNNSSGEMELDFEYIHNEEHTVTFLNIANSMTNLSSSVMSNFKKILDIREERLRDEKLKRISFLNIANAITNLSSSVMLNFRKILDIREERLRDEKLKRISFLNIAIAITKINKREVK
jgi:aspartate carbamoyltransferase regulatory subunit